MKKPQKSQNEMELISFRLSKDLVKKLRAYADEQVDESGKTLSPSLAARRLMLESLNKKSK